MRYEVEYDTDESLVCSTFHGALTLDDVLDTLSNMYADPRFVKSTRHLWDLREVSLNDMTNNDVQGISDFVTEVRQALPGVRVAIVADSDLTFGMARMYQSLVSDDKIQPNVFRTINDAREWLFTTEA